ncbi:MAG: hypothetical protein OXC60_04130 [Litoreibacter sp.]|nr:hypothetical protein [Litoreibacter sp.]
MVEKSDAAYRYVKQANVKEARNRAAGERAHKPSAGLNAVAALLLLNVSYYHWSREEPWFSLFVLALASFNGWVAFKTFKHQDS